MLDTAAINKQLTEIFERDQTPRRTSDFKSLRKADSTNLAQVEEIIAKYGWLGRSVIGREGNHTLWIVIQHAPLKKEKQYLPLIERSVADSETSPVYLAYLQDRINMYEHKKQLYGTQAMSDSTTKNVMTIWPIEDERTVNIRRAKLGLEPVEKYAGELGAAYTPPPPFDTVALKKLLLQVEEWDQTATHAPGHRQSYDSLYTLRKALKDSGQFNAHYRIAFDSGFARLDSQCRVYGSLAFATATHILDTYGWLGKSIIGYVASDALFLVVQHATDDTVTQKKYFPMLERSFEIGESTGQQYALLKDRILMRDGKQQIYGTQTWKNPKTNHKEFWPIEDGANVNQRRKKMGMASLEEYAKVLDVWYPLPKE